MVLDRLGSKNSEKTWKKSQPALRSSQLYHRQVDQLSTNHVLNVMTDCGYGEKGVPSSARD